MILLDFLRALIAFAGAILMLLSLYGVIYAMSDRAWDPAFSAFLGALFGFWLFNVGLTGRLSGRRKRPSPTA
jgi:hypothetical protein